MRTLLAILILALPCAAMAADDYTLGSYWTVTSVDTKPGHFDDYMADLKRVWRKSLDMMNEEPDLWLLVEWTSGAAYLDTPQEYWDAQTAKLFGSEDAGQAANIKRGDLREILGNSLLREMSFTD